MTPHEFSTPQLGFFLLQGLLFSLVFPFAFIAYQWVRAPQRQSLVMQSLMQLGVNEDEAQLSVSSYEYRTRDYLWPVVYTSLLVFVLYSLSHPYTIDAGIWSGVLEEFVDVFGVDTQFSRDVVAGRFLFWGWVGAWVYSLNLILRRFLAYDLTPGVFVYVIGRFTLAWIIGAIVGMALGTFSRQAGVETNTNLVTVFLVTFFIGFFPERGLNWITAAAKRALGQQGGISKETRLSELEGLSIWHQGRLQQEGIENVQNLATADIPALIVFTPFTVGQIIDWVDQAILCVYANQMYTPLEDTGIRCASDFLTAAGYDERIEQLSRATEINVDKLHMLHIGIQSATNIGVTAKFRWRTSMDESRLLLAHNIKPYETGTMRAIVTSNTPAEPEATSKPAQAT
jgi:hypothetical protein